MKPAAWIVPEICASPEWILPLIPIFSPLFQLCPLPEMGRNTLGQEVMGGGTLCLRAPELPPEAREKLGQIAAALAEGSAFHQRETLRQLIFSLLHSEPGLETTGELRRELQHGPGKNQAAREGAIKARVQQCLTLLLENEARREQTDLHAGLKGVGQSQKKMFQAVLGLEERGENEDVSSCLAKEAGEYSPAWLRAWTGLFAALPPMPGCKAASTPENAWFLTRNAGLFSQLLAAYHKQTYGQALQVGEFFLPLPANQKEAQALARAGEPLALALAELNRPAVCQTTVAGSLNKNLAVSWNKAALAQNSKALSVLRLYILPGVDFPPLLQSVAQKNAQGQAQQPASLASCCIGLVQAAQPRG